MGEVGEYVKRIPVDLSRHVSVGMSHALFQALTQPSRGQAWNRTIAADAHQSVVAPYPNRLAVTSHQLGHIADSSPLGTAQPHRAIEIPAFLGQQQQPVENLVQPVDLLGG